MVAGSLGTLVMSKIRTLSNGGQVFFCPGCESTHAVNFHPNGPKWTYNGNAEKPTFNPSILVRLEWSKNMDPGDNPDEYRDEVCHSFVRDGMIQFLGDCTHALAGKTVEIPEWPHRPGSYGGVQE